MQSKYAVVIVTFQPDIERVVHNVKALQKQGFFVVIVDNFSKNINMLPEINSPTRRKASEKLFLTRNQPFLLL